MRSVPCVSLFTENRLQWSKPAEILSINPVVRSKSYNIPMLTPVAEYDTEVGSVGSVGIRRHSACEVTSCMEQQGFPLSVSVETSSSPGISLDHELTLPTAKRGATAQPALILPSIFIQNSAGHLHAQTSISETDKATSSPTSCSSSPETIVMQGVDSVDSDQDGIFIDFSHCRSDSFGNNRKTSWFVEQTEFNPMIYLNHYTHGMCWYWCFRLTHVACDEWENLIWEQNFFSFFFPKVRNLRRQLSLRCFPNGSLLLFNLRSTNAHSLGSLLTNKTQS